jgi:aspartate racemase
VLTLVQSGNVRGLCGYLSRIIEYLAQAGCTFAAIAAATSHLCIDELQERSTIPLISLVDAVRMEVERRGAKRVCVFGTRFVMESDLLGALTAVDVVHLHPEDLLRVNEIYTSLARRGAASSHEREELVRLAETLVLKDGVDTIILGGTDLSAVFEESETSFPALDASDAHIASIVREVLESNEI